MFSLDQAMDGVSDGTITFNMDQLDDNYSPLSIPDHYALSGFLLPQLSTAEEIELSSDLPRSTLV